MKYTLRVATTLLVVSRIFGLDGQPGIHDPSTIILHDGKYYVYGAGAGLPIEVAATAELLLPFSALPRMNTLSMDGS